MNTETSAAEIHALCGRKHRDDEERWFCWAARTYYAPEAAPRRSHDEVVQDRDARARAIAARREFNRRKRAEREARKAAQAVAAPAPQPQAQAQP